MSLLNKEKIWDAVIYADGGANPNPGFAGYGIHGYFFQSAKNTDFAPPKKPIVYANHFMEFFNKDEIKLNYVVLTSKGYVDYFQKDEEKYKDFLVTPEVYIDRCFSFSAPETNNVAEMQALLEVFNEIGGLEDVKISKLSIILDSRYVLNTITEFGDKYRENRWLKSDGEVPKNLEIIKLLLIKRDAIISKGIKIEYFWCKGHNGNMGNGMADYHATVAVRRAKDLNGLTDTVWSPAKKYWDLDVDRHPLMFAKRSYFNRVRKYNKPGQYYLIEPASDDLMIGKRDHEGYAVVRLKTPCPFMESVIEAQGKFGQDDNRVILGRMDRIYNKFVQKFIRIHGTYCFNSSDNGRAVNFLDMTPVAVEHNPPALIYRVTEAFQNLDERLEEFVQLTSLGDDYKQNIDGIVIHDITHEIYDTVEKKNGKEIVSKLILKPELINGYRNHVLNMEETLDGVTFKFKTPLALGMDLPSRNCLKKLEEESPKIYLITWRSSPQTLQYACVVDSISGLGIWSNYFCDRVFLKQS